MKVAFSWRRWSTLELNISQICGISGTKSLQNRHSLKSQVNCNSFSSRMSFSAQKQAGAGESMNFPWNQNRHLNFVPLLWFRCRTCKGLFPKVSLIDRWQILTVFFFTRNTRDWRFNSFFQTSLRESKVVFAINKTDINSTRKILIVTSVDYRGRPGGSPRLTPFLGYGFPLRARMRRGYKKSADSDSGQKKGQKVHGLG